MLLGESADFPAQFLGEIVLVLDFAPEIPGHETVFQAQLLKPGPGTALGEEVFHFFDEASFHAADEAVCDTLAQGLPIPFHAQNEGANRGRGFGGGRLAEYRYFDGPLQAIALQEVGRVVGVRIELQ